MQGKSQRIISYEAHPQVMNNSVCFMMEHQSLLDVAILCGNNTIHAHKLYLAAASPYFREELEKNPGTEQIVMNGIDVAVMRNLIEFIYCGCCKAISENYNLLLALGNFLKIEGLNHLAVNNKEQDEVITIVPPTFLTKKPKYPVAYVPPPSGTPVQTNSNPSPSMDGSYRKVKRSRTLNRLDLEMDKAIAREAAASKMTVDNLRKQLGPGNTMDSYDLETSCTVTTVENFIPSSSDEDPYIKNMDDEPEAEPVGVMDYDVVAPVMNMDMTKDSLLRGTLLPIDMSKKENQCVDKIRDVIGNIDKNIEVYYKSDQGDLVAVNDDILRDLGTTSLQIQLINVNEQEQQENPPPASASGAFVQQQRQFEPYNYYMNSDFGFDTNIMSEPMIGSHILGDNVEGFSLNFNGDERSEQNGFEHLNQEQEADFLTDINSLGIFYKDDEQNMFEVPGETELMAFGNSVGDMSMASNLQEEEEEEEEVIEID